MNHRRYQKIIALQQRLEKSGMIFGVPENTHKSDKQSFITSNFKKDFPSDLLQKPVLNEISPAIHGDISAYGFTLIALRNMPITEHERFLWCMAGHQPYENGLLFAPGLKSINVNPAKIIQLETRRTIDLLWAMEEAARSGAVKAVVGIVDNISFTQSRRLSLAAARGQTPIFMLRPHYRDGASTAFSRWRISSRPSQINIFNAKAPGLATYQVELYKCRDGRKGKWTCHYENRNHNNTQRQAHHLSMAATSDHRAPEPLKKRIG